MNFAGQNLKLFREELFASDIINGVYEGGFKVWEGALNLLRLITDEGSDVEGKRVIELGCGQGQPGILCLHKGAKSVVFQDFNSEVIEGVTKPLLQECLTPELSEKCSFAHGDWSTLSQETVGEADVMIMGDTVYEIKSFPALYAAIRKLLSYSGNALLSCQRYYYGVGGGSESWIDFVEKRNEFEISEYKVISDGKSVDRVILSMKWKEGANRDSEVVVEEEKQGDFMFEF